MGRSKAAKQGGSGRKNSSGQGGTASSAKATLKAAEQSQQRGERRSGLEAVPHLQEAIEKYRQCMSQRPDADTLANAQVLCSETLQVLAKAHLDVEEQLPDAEQSTTVERAAKNKALELYAEAVQVAKQTRNSSDGAWLRADAVVNCGNFLSEAAELSPAEQQISLLMEAVSCYESALNLEPDAVTWSNLADSLIQLSQALSSTQRLSDVEEAVTRARAAFQSSCSNSSAFDGDDLPGLLCNWGTGLATVAGLLRDAGVHEKAIEVHKEAVMRINNSLDMQPTDVQVHIAHAEAQSGLLETLADILTPDTQPRPSAAPSAASAWQEVGTAALAACDAALNIQRDHVSALVGKAEVHALHAKILGHIGQNGSATCSQHWNACIQCYEKVLGAPQKLGSFSERCTVRYNCSCALAMAGRTQDALGLLTWLSQKNPEALVGSQEDAQLQSLWNLKEFHALLPAAGR